VVETLFQDTKYWNRDSEIPGSNIPPPPSYEQSSQDVTGNFSYTNREHPWEKSPETGIFVPVVEEESPPLDQNERKSSFLTQYRRIRCILLLFSLIILLSGCLYNEESSRSSTREDVNDEIQNREWIFPLGPTLGGAKLLKSVNFTRVRGNMNIELGNKHELDAQTLRDFAEQFGDSNGESEITSKSDVPKNNDRVLYETTSYNVKENVKNLTAESDSDEKKEENWWDAIGKLFN